MEELLTDRLIIKRTSINDVDLLLKMDKQVETQKYLGGIKDKSKEDRIDFLKKKVNSYTVYLKNSIKIGFINIKNNNEISYIFDYDYTNNGYCTEAIKEILIYMKSNVIAKVRKENISSIRVLEKCGFKYKNTDNEEFMIYEYSAK